MVRSLFPIKGLEASLSKMVIKSAPVWGRGRKRTVRQTVRQRQQEKAKNCRGFAIVLLCEDKGSFGSWGWF